MGEPVTAGGPLLGGMGLLWDAWKDRTRLIVDVYGEIKGGEGKNQVRENRGNGMKRTVTPQPLGDLRAGCPTDSWWWVSPLAHSCP